MSKAIFPILLLIIIFSLQPLLAGQNTATITYTSRIDQPINDKVTWEVMERGTDSFRPLVCSPTEIALPPRKTVTVSCTSDDFPSIASGPHTLRITLRGEATITTYGKAKNCEDIGGRCKLFGCLSTETEASDASCSIGQTCCVLNPPKKCDKNPALCTGDNICYLTDPDLKLIASEAIIKQLETESSGIVLPQDYKARAMQGCIPQTIFEKFIKKDCRVLACKDFDTEYPQPGLQVPSSCTTSCKDTTPTSFMPRQVNDVCKDSQTILEATCKGNLCIPLEYKCHNGQECKTDQFTRKGYCACTASSSYLKIIKFSDNNGNGVQDEDETGVSGIRFMVKNKTSEISLVTDENGEAIYSCLIPGIYEITEADAQSGWVLTTPKTVNLEVKKDDMQFEVKFGNKPLGTIKIVTFQDNNADGDKGATEPTLPGFKVSVKQPDGKIIQLTTDSSGEATLPELPMGKYEATVEEKPGLDLTSEKTQEAVLTPNDKSETLYFGSEKPETPVTCGFLKVLKFNDSNSNKTLDSGEALLSGFTFQAISGSKTFNIGPTNSNGEASSTCIPIGDYSVSETPLPGWTLTTGIKTATINASNTENNPEVLEFGNHKNRLVTQECNYLKIIKFNDTDSDGIRDDNEESLPGFNFSVTGPGESFTLTTGPDGSALSRCLPYGVYSASEVDIPADWASTTPSKTVSIGPGNTQQSPAILQFGNRKKEIQIEPPACGYLKIIKFEDTNKNDVRDKDEPLLRGFTFQVVNGEQSLVTAPTNSTGEADTPCMPSGTYTITETNIPEGWAPIVSQKTVTISTADTEKNPRTLDFGNKVLLAGIKVLVFDDLNTNGTWDKDEPRHDDPRMEVTFWRIREKDLDLYDSLQGLVGGEHLESNVPVDPPKYSVHLSRVSGYTCTTCEGLTFQKTVTAELGKVVPALFGLSKIPSGDLKITKFADTDGDGVWDKAEGEPILEGFKFNVTRTESNQKYSVKTNYNGIGLLEGLPIGDYTVEEVDIPEDYKNTTPKKITGVKIEENKETPLTFGNKMITGTLTILKKGMDGKPLTGFRFYAYRDGSKVLDNILVDSDGKLVMKDLKLGKYKVLEAAKDGWEVLGKNTQEVELTAKKPSATVTFKNREKMEGEGLIRIMKYDDANANGKYDPGENPIQGVTFNVYIDPGLEDKADILNEDPYYSIQSLADGVAMNMNNIPAGYYIVTEVPQSGWEPSPNKETGSKQSTFLNGDKDYVLMEKVLLEDGDTARLFFGNKKPLEEGGGGFIVPETKCDGILIQKSAMIDGVAQTTGLDKFTFEVTTPDGKTSEKNTDALGKIMVCSGAGNYEVTEIVPDGWTATPSGTHKVEVPSPPESSGDSEEEPEPIMITVSFVNTKGAQVTTLVINKTVDDPKQKLDGWLFNITYPNGKTEEKVTDLQGIIRLTGIAPGEYTVEELVGKEWIVLPSKVQTMEVPEKQTRTLKFTNSNDGKYLWVKKVVEDKGASLRGWKFNITLPDKTSSISETDDKGQILFRAENPGNYTVEEVVPEGWKSVPEGPLTKTYEDGYAKYVLEEFPDKLSPPFSFKNIPKDCPKACLNTGFDYGSCKQECAVGKPFSDNKVDIVVFIDTENVDNASMNSMVKYLVKMRDTLKGQGYDLKFDIYPLGEEWNALYIKQGRGYVKEDSEVKCDSDGLCQIYLEGYGWAKMLTYTYFNKQFFGGTLEVKNKDGEAVTSFETMENWGTATTWAAWGKDLPDPLPKGAFRHEWRTGGYRIIVPITGECPIGDMCDKNGWEALEEALSITRQTKVRVYPIITDAEPGTLDETSFEAIDRFATGTGGKMIHYNGDSLNYDFGVALSSMFGEVPLEGMDCSDSKPLCCCGNDEDKAETGEECAPTIDTVEYSCEAEGIRAKLILNNSGPGCDFMVQVYGDNKLIQEYSRGLIEKGKDYLAGIFGDNTRKQISLTFAPGEAATEGYEIIVQGRSDKNSFRYSFSDRAKVCCSIDGCNIGDKDVCTADPQCQNRRVGYAWDNGICNEDCTYRKMGIDFLPPPESDAVGITGTDDAVTLKFKAKGFITGSSIKYENPDGNLLYFSSLNNTIASSDDLIEVTYKCIKSGKAQVIVSVMDIEQVYTSSVQVMCSEKTVKETPELIFLDTESDTQGVIYSGDNILLKFKAKKFLVGSAINYYNPDGILNLDGTPESRIKVNSEFEFEVSYECLQKGPAEVLVGVSTPDGGVSKTVKVECLSNTVGTAKCDALPTPGVCCAVGTSCGVGQYVVGAVDCPTQCCNNIANCLAPSKNSMEVVFVPVGYKTEADIQNFKDYVDRVKKYWLDETPLRECADKNTRFFAHTLDRCSAAEPLMASCQLDRVIDELKVCAQNAGYDPNEVYVAGLYNGDIHKLCSSIPGAGEYKYALGLGECGGNISLSSGKADMLVCGARTLVDQSPYIIVHELGHNLWLSQNNIDTDPTHNPGHSADSDSIMWWQAMPFDVKTRSNKDPGTGVESGCVMDKPVWKDQDFSSEDYASLTTYMKSKGYLVGCKI